MTPILPDDPLVARAAATVLAVDDSLDAGVGPPGRLEGLRVAEARGYFTPDEDEAIRARYRAYLAGRASLLETLRTMDEICGPSRDDWDGRLPAFVVGLGAACLLLRGSREWVGLAQMSRLLRHKLDEADTLRGIPRKTFTQIYRAATDPRRIRRFDHAIAFHRHHRGVIRGIQSDGRLGELGRRLERWVDCFSPIDPPGIWRDRVRYRWFSFRRRHHSAWKQAVFGIFEDAGSKVADLRQPTRARGPKRVSPELQQAILSRARPGDVFVTRHDDALSNLFLPGFWPHAALYVGSAVPSGDAAAADGPCFIEAKKDGVRYRQAGETLAVDRLIVLRPPLDACQIDRALARAAEHVGKLYDFVFDFRKSDRLVCTEVVYRAYHGIGGLDFKLVETGGRLCLPAEALIDQALAAGFKVVLGANLSRDGLLHGQAAEIAMHGARAGL